jgi:hypothetical protein
VTESPCPRSGSACYAIGTSSRGRIVAIKADSPEGRDTYSWDEKHGARRLRTLLVANGATIDPGLMRLFVDDLSDDGLVVVGTVLDVDHHRIFRATLPQSVFD